MTCKGNWHHQLQDATQGATASRLEAVPMGEGGQHPKLPITEDTGTSHLHAIFLLGDGCPGCSQNGVSANFVFLLQDTEFT